MKNLILLCLAGLVNTFALAQKTSLAGVVNNQDGKPVAFAFIKDAKHNYATFTDSYGAFTFKVDTASRLIVSAAGYKTVVIAVTDPQNIAVSLSADGSAITKPIDAEILKEKLSTEGMTKNAATGYIAKEASLHGTRYFFENWVHGFVISDEDSLKQNNNYLFNYNKIDGSLLLTTDGKTMKEIDRGMVKSFTLFDDAGQTYVFEKQQAIDGNHFLVTLSTGPKYKIFKQLGTKFYPNNYVSNGMTSTGNNYDEIKDAPLYYVVKLPGGAPQKLALKSKAIKAVFIDDAAKVSKYLSEHDVDIDDRYLIELGDYLNY